MVIVCFCIFSNISDLNHFFACSFDFRCSHNNSGLILCCLRDLTTVLLFHQRTSRNVTKPTDSKPTFQIQDCKETFFAEVKFLFSDIQSVRYKKHRI